MIPSGGNVCTSKMGLSRSMILRLLALFAFCCYVIDGKVFEQCDLAKLLKDKHRLPIEEVANWVCIAKHQSNLNSDLRTGSPDSGAHGLFQISDQFWCSLPGKGGACGITCDRLRDDDLTDDLECIARIYDEHQRISGDGYSAWTTYERSCKGRARKSIEGCFETTSPKQGFNYFDSFANSIVPSLSKTKSKVYTSCELAKELRFKHNIPLDQIETWVCIVKHESNFNTSAIGRLNADGSGDHGLFQISDIYWCSPPGKGWACGLSCDELEDSDITDDVECIKRIYEEHTRISGDGFNAWAVYQPYCKSRTQSYTTGCFNDAGTTIDSQTSSFGLSTELPPWNFDFKPKKPGKVYTPCELAKELRYKHKVPMDQIATWICIAKHESNFNTSAIGRLNSDGSGDHGLFQISDIYWCSPPGNGWACGLSCSDLEDADITNDVECIKKIYEEHTRLSGDGFNAWTVYKPHCKGRSEAFIQGCFNDFESNTISAQSYIPDRGSHRSPSKPKVGRGKVYSPCELAKELRYKYYIPLEQINTWVCIAKHESNFNTSAIGRLNVDGSGDHGLFQISDIYWCSPPGNGWACGLSCSDLEDSDITDDVECIKKIYEEHTRLSGDGFNAWAVYKPYCESRSKSYIGGCFDDYSGTETNSLVPAVEPKYEFRGPSKTYTRCELAEELRSRHRLPESQIATWVCIAEHESNLNTGAMNAGSGDHGLFQISELFWCDKSGPGKECRVECGKFRDNDITDDVECIKKIFKEHSRLSGDGFNAWVVYPQRCKGRSEEYIKSCSQSATKPPFITERPPFIVPAITAPTNLLDYSQQFSKHLQSTKSAFSSVRFSDFLRKPQVDASNQIYENPPTTKSSLFSFNFGELFQKSTGFDSSSDNILSKSSSQIFDNTFFSTQRPYNLLSPPNQQENSEKFGFLTSKSQNEKPASTFGAGSRFDLPSASSTLPEFTATKKPFGSIFDEASDSVFNFGQRPINLAIKEKTTTTAPSKSSTSREDRFAGFAAFDATSRFSTTKSPFTVKTTKSTLKTTTKDPFPSRSEFKYNDNFFGRFDSTTSTARPIQKDSFQGLGTKSTTDADTDIFDFYFDLYNIKPKSSNKVAIKSPVAITTTTNAPLLVQAPETTRMKQYSVYSSSPTTTLRPFAASGFSATPEFRGVRFGVIYDVQSSKDTTTLRSTSSFPAQRVTYRPQIQEKGYSSSSRSKQLEAITTSTTTRPSRFKDITTRTPFTIKARPLSVFRFGSAIDSEQGSSEDAATRKPMNFRLNSSSSYTKNEAADNSVSRNTFGIASSFGSRGLSKQKPQSDRKTSGVSSFGSASEKSSFNTETSRLSSSFGESPTKFEVTTNTPGRSFESIFDSFVH